MNETLIVVGILAVILWTLHASPWVWGLVAFIASLVIAAVPVLWALAGGVLVWAVVRSL